MRTRIALVTGCSGQDGFYLSHLLKDRGYRIIGTTRSSGDEYKGDVPVDAWVYWDGLQQEVADGIIAEFRPDELYNFAAFTSGQGMYQDPVGIGEINGLAVVRLLESIRRISPDTRMAQASSSEVFGQPASAPQSEKAARNPRSPYGAAKLYADNMVRLYRERYGIFACSAFLFNHESPRRGMGFVSRKVSYGAAAISLGIANHLLLGNLDARRDWGFAGDHVQAMWLMLQAEGAEDYVVGTGVSHSVRDICRFAFEHVGLDYQSYVREDPEAYRMSEAVPLVGDIGKARKQLQWEPSVGLKTLVQMMVEYDVVRLRQQIANNGAINEPV